MEGSLHLPLKHLQRSRAYRTQKQS